MDRYDIIVVGSGPGGYIAAIRAAQVGYSVALVERESSLGGVCLNWGCIPTKALLKTAELLKKIANADTYGIKVAGAAQVDIAEVVANSRSAVAHLGAGVAFLMKKNGVKLYTGNATTLGKGEILVSSSNGEVKLAGRHIVLATGSRPRMLQNVEQELLWTAKDAMVPTELPKSILIVGSGAIGIEFASFYEALGSKVTIVELQDRILPLEDDSISSAMGKILQSQGVTVLVNSSVCSLVRSDEGLTAEVKNMATKQSSLVTFDRVCCAIGVVPNSDNLGLENTGVELDRNGFILTDNLCETSDKGLYAIGDVAGQPCLAHKASHEAVICIEGIATREG
ncbi:dihydrolipoyl dehydrogenase family protein, partial [Candidatus Anaplasma sp. TIGMIC]|uniref:dihydrolipoyl dehydrogenase family protein n=1 Tax=Candidatus Anaplasma sp. TIGMIC TaxID=3020713 RepID=UPI002330F573